MAIVQQINFESGRLNVDAQGEFSLEEAKSAFLEMLSAIAQYRAQRVLFDGRNVKGNPEDLERFYYGEFAAKHTLRLVGEHKIVPQFAYVITEPLRDPRRFGETVALNRGMHIKVFAALEEAVEWLSLTPGNDADTGIP
jgi:hypothetical protein